MNRATLICGGLTLAMAGVGCARKKELKPIPTPTPMSTAVPTPVPAPLRSDNGPPKALHYVVGRGDSLWSIAADRGVLGDPFRWPLIYKQNRDQIQDPDLIEVKQDLAYSRSEDSRAIADAVHKAQATPPYVPHDRPRKTLPLNY